LVLAMAAILAGCGGAGYGGGGVTVPVAPTAVTATGGNGQVTLMWTGSAGATSYYVKRATVSGGPYTQIATVAATNYLDSVVTNGAVYFYVVTAYNSAGESGNSAQASATPAVPAPDVTVTVDPTKTKAISPYIYGVNSYSGISGAPAMLTLDRAGGNRWTAYNWETNASNAGNDFHFQNDGYLSASSTPAEAVLSFIAADQAANLASIMTVQMQGLVSADESGPVNMTNPPISDATNFRSVVDKKNAAFTLTPPPATTDNNVYMDEFIWAVDQSFSGMGIFGSSATQPVFINLDNEPELWNSTHKEIQGPTAVTSDNYISKTITLSKALKDQFPNAMIFGPVHYGFEGIYSWQGELAATPNGTNWFPDKYLPAIKSASTTYGKPLVDVYDFHWYPEDYDASSNRVTSMSGTTLTDAQVQLIVQSPRNLWDPTYSDNASAGNSNPWVYNTLGAPIQILPRLQAKIDAENPGMKLSITEYEAGGWNHIAGTIAQADMLGIFGNEGLFAACLWPPSPSGSYPYALGGFRAFRGFDGSNAVFGDTSQRATSSNVGNVVVYASSDSKTAGRVVFVAINRSTTTQVTAINGVALSGTAHLYQMTATSAQTQVAANGPVAPVSVGTMAASGTSVIPSAESVSCAAVSWPRPPSMMTRSGQGESDASSLAASASLSMSGSIAACSSLSPSFTGRGMG